MKSSLKFHQISINFSNLLRKTIYPHIYPKITKINYETAQNVEMWNEQSFLTA